MDIENATAQQTGILGFSIGDRLCAISCEEVLNSIKKQPESFWNIDIQLTNDYSLRQQTVASSQNTPPYQRIVVDPADVIQFIDSVDISCLEPGYINRAELFVESLCRSKGEAYVIQMMNDIYTKYPSDELLMCVVINILSCIEYEKLGSFAITLCIGLIAVGTPMIWEYVADACDRWNSKDFIPCLQRITTESVLLKRLVNKVIARLQQ